jgi:4-aminobutyrate aminotransferase
MSHDNIEHLKSEGDLNISPRRAAWSQQHVGAKAQAILQEDAKYFLHQSLSTPCLNVLQGSQGASITDIEGRNLLDFHGNNGPMPCRKIASPPTEIASSDAP